MTGTFYFNCEKILFKINKSFKHPDLQYYTERLFVRVNHKNELYFSIISFHNKTNRVYVSENNIVVFKRQS